MYFVTRYSLVVLLIFAGLALSQSTQPKRPNIVLIMCDDMGFSDLGCYGGEIRTPHLDRLAGGGMRFTQFYNNAKCTTTRASILTGLYPRFGSGGHLRPGMITLGEALGAAGYQTGLFGKWHLLRTKGGDKSKIPGDWIDRYDRSTHPFFRGFNRFYGLLDGCCNFFDPMIPDPPYKGGGIRKFGFNSGAVTDFPEGYYSTDAFTDHAIAAVHDFHQQDAPFLIHLCYTAPHYPIQAPQGDIDRYRGKYTGGWDQLRQERWSRQQETGLAAATWKLTGSDPRAYAWETANHDFEDHRMAVYAAMIDRMDQNIGRLLQSLDETGEIDNTLVLFLSDNGGCAEEPGGRNPTKRRPGPADDYVAVGPSWGWAQNAPFRRYKTWVHEGGITTPLIASWPGNIKPGSINRAPSHIIDLMPTFLELAGSTYPGEFAGQPLLPLEGRSMTGMLKGLKVKAQRSLAWYWSRNRAFRDGDWKVVWEKGAKRWELYDIGRDRCETHDLASAHPKRVREMADRWEAWSREVGLRKRK